jgi:hypothetical protein
MKFLEDYAPRDKRFCSIVPLLMAGGAVAGMGGSIFSGIMGKSAAKKQEESIRQAQEKATGAVQKYSDQAQGWLRSFRERGDTASQSIEDILAGKLNLDDMVQSSSLFKFQQQEGERGINRQLRARGMYGSGAGLETLARFESQLVGEEGERYMSRLFDMSKQGLSAGSQLSSQDMATGKTLADLFMRSGETIGQARAGGDLAMGQMGQGIAGAVQGGLTTGLQYHMMAPMIEAMTEKLNKGNGTGGSMADNGALQEALGRGIVAGTRMPPVSAYAPTNLAPPLNEYSMGSQAPRNWASNF